MTRKVGLAGWPTCQSCHVVLFIFYYLTTMTKMALTVQTNEDHSQELGSNITKILDDFFSGGYDRRVRPNYGGPAVEVGVTMFIISISTVSEVQMDFTLDFYFRQAWKDPRLAFRELPRISELYVGAEVADRIWVPDTFFANEKSAYFHIATTKNTFLRIGAKGDVFRSIRLTVTASCPMDLQYFPMDRQLCSIEIESYGYSMADIKYVWGKAGKSVGLDDKLSLPQFRVVGHRQQDKVITLSTGNYSRLICDIQFARSLGFYLIQIYIPATLIVVISWVSFWLHRNATPARVALGVTTVLTMTTLMSSTNSQLPKISYIKSIDVFLGTCFVMVFASLIEYATVGYLGKRIAMRKTRAEQMAKLEEEKRKKLHGGGGGGATGQEQQNGGQGGPPPVPQLPPDLPPPVPPGPMGIVNPMLCPLNSSSPRQMQYKHAHIYHPGGTLPHRPGGGGGLYDHFPCSPQGLQSCTPIRTCTPTHIICSHPDGATGLSGHPMGHPSEIRLKMADAGMIINKEGPRKDPDSGNMPTMGHMGGHAKKPKKNPNKLLGVAPSDIDKYSRVIFPVCFICFNLMYWIIYSHISDTLADNLVLLGS